MVIWINSEMIVGKINIADGSEIQHKIKNYIGDNLSYLLHFYSKKPNTLVFHFLDRIGYSGIIHLSSFPLGKKCTKSGKCLINKE